MFSSEFCEIFKSAYFEEYLWIAAFEIRQKQLCDLQMVLFIAFNRTSDTYLETCLTPIMKLFTKIVNKLKPLTIFAKKTPP